MSDHQSPEPRPRIIELSACGISSSTAVCSPTVWMSYSFAPEWFLDAINEARNGSDHQARRRELIFAVCFAESYLVEWVRDVVLKRDFNRLNEFFPPGKWVTVVDKWKDVPKALFDAGLIKSVPNRDGQYWKDWLMLIEMRNGLIHARASRPQTDGQPEKHQPLPSKRDLDELAAGWAVRVVVSLVKSLHTAAGGSLPAWLVEP